MSAVPHTRVTDVPFPTVLGVGLAGAAGTVVGALLPWSRVRLSDRGTSLLTVTSTGHSAHFPGWWVIVLAVVAAAVTVGVGFRLAAAYGVLVAVLAGIVITVLAVTARHSDAGVVNRLRHVRFGTFQYDQHVVTSSTAYGLWITAAGGLVLAVATFAWLVRNRPAAD